MHPGSDRSLIARVALALISCSLPAGAESPRTDCRVLLERTAQKYASLRSYVVKVRQSDEDRPGFINSEYLVAYRDPTHFRWEANSRSSPVKFTLLVVSDGVSVWSFRRELKEYIEEPCRIEPGRTKPYGTDRFARVNATYVYRFRHLASFADRARVLGTEELRRDKARIRTTVVELHPPPGEYWAERLWVDQDTGLIAKSAFKHRAEFTMFMLLDYDYPYIDTALPDELFQFQPPPKTRRVERFRRIR